MCAACIEYAKGTLNLNEFRSALRETTMEDAAHAKEVARIVSEFASDPDELKRQLKALEARR